ncbi:MAG: hypothetical protein K9N62_20250 [Verrucomicrobia bacterium]|nr:hypothetical protein [Verrucomicrobiota bacterium]
MIKKSQSSGRSRLALLAAALPLLGLSTQAQSPVTQGLIAYWNFDKSDFKDSVGEFHGTENGSDAIAFTAGKGGFGQSMVLNGVDQYVEITGGEPDDLAFEGGSMSVAGWFKVAAFDRDWQALIAKGEGSNWRIHRRGGESGFAHAGGIGEGPAGGAVDDGEWHHFAAISDVDAVNFGTALYVDGVQYTKFDTAPALAANGKRVMIGENPDALGRFWNGEVDDIGLWNRVLQENEIAQLYAAGNGKAISAFFAPEVDTDKDGLPDWWETKFGLNINDAADAKADSNGNGYDNTKEFALGLDPKDTTTPKVNSAASNAAFDTVTLTFSKPLDATAAALASNYSISPALAITAVSYKNKVVTLTTAKQAVDTAYTVTLKGIKDVSNFEIAAANRSVTFYSYTMLRTGVLKFSYYSDIPGTPVDNLWADPKFPDSPDMVQAVFSFNSRDAFPDDSHENYGAMIEGFVSPTESGQYHFFLRSDDASELYISTDDSPANLQYTAWQTGCCNAFAEPGADFTTFDPISLTAGRKYFVRLIYKEGGGGDYGQVAWRKEGDTTAAASLTPIPGIYLSANVDLPAPAEGGFVTQAPASNAANVSPVPQVTIVHRDGKSAWTAANTSIMFDGAAVTSSFSKVGNVATLTYKGNGVLASESEHTVTLGYPDPAGKAATTTWTYTVAKFQGPVLDKVGGVPALLNGSGDLSGDGTGKTGKAGDRAFDLGTGGVSGLIPDASFINASTAQSDALTFSIWTKGNGVRNSSIFWADSPSSSGNQRGFQAHTPWGNNNIYFDTAGCCDGVTQRISAATDTLTGYTDTDWWNDTTWHHFAFTKDGATKKIWIDGKLFLEGQNTSPLPSDFTQVWLGAEGGGSSGNANNMHGLLDDYAVFGTALGEADIAKLVAGDAPTTLAASTKMLAYWSFDEITASASPATLANGLKAYWSFDGNLSDPVGKFNGTARGTAPVAYGAGKAGQAIVLDGSNFVEITGGNNKDLQFPGGSMSIGGWFKVGAFDKDWQALLSKGEGSNYRVARRGGGNSIGYAGGVGEGADDAPNVNDGNWHHFVAVSDATLAAFGTALYVDGKLYSVNAAAPVLADGDKNLFIGENPEALNRRWVGSIDDIGIWNRVLSAGEVGLLYNGGAGLALSAVPGVPAGGGGGTGGGIGVSRTATSLTITYQGTLQSSDSIVGPFTDVPGAASPATIPFSGSGKFYRTRQ